MCVCESVCVCVFACVSVCERVCVCTCECECVYVSECVFVLICVWEKIMLVQFEQNNGSSHTLSLNFRNVSNLCCPLAILWVITWHCLERCDTVQCGRSASALRT